MMDHEPCPGRSCEFVTCPAHDDCFLRRRAAGRGDMIWDEGWSGPEPAMSHHVQTGLRLMEWEQRKTKRGRPL